jgi:hypothetical protein
VQTGIGKRAALEGGCALRRGEWRGLEVATAACHHQGTCEDRAREPSWIDWFGAWGQPPSTPKRGHWPGGASKRRDARAVEAERRDQDDGLTIHGAASIACARSIRTTLSHGGAGVATGGAQRQRVAALRLRRVLRGGRL